MHPPTPGRVGTKKLLAMAMVAIIAVAAIAIIFMSPSAPVNNDAPGVEDPFPNAEIMSDGEFAMGSMVEGQDDFYKIWLEPGQVLAVSLAGAPGTDFDIYVYQSTGFDDDHLINSSFNIGTSAENLQIVAWEQAYYVINVYAYEGEGNYRLDVNVLRTISLDDGNNHLDDAPLLAERQVVQGTLNKYYDTDDYYAVFLPPNWVVEAELTVPGNCDFDLYLYDSEGEIVDYSINSYGAEHIKYW
ncbi:MAG: PPC domain-containing protein, partial [Candidatus Thermoplasmatota archaeon]|nr:PPC domain-containing protein [Candidatus Thermoplasmatota archaeon]